MTAISRPLTLFRLQLFPDKVIGQSDPYQAEYHIRGKSLQLVPAYLRHLLLRLLQLMQLSKNRSPMRIPSR
jgi:hypothetical protein